MSDGGSCQEHRRISYWQVASKVRTGGSMPLPHRPGGSDASGYPIVNE